METMKTNFAKAFPAFSPYGERGASTLIAERKCSRVKQCSIKSFAGEKACKGKSCDKTMSNK